MKKLLLPLLLAAVMVTASCGKKGDDTAASPSPSAPAATATVSPVPAEVTEAPASTEASGTVADTGGTNMTRMSPDDVADEVIADGRKAKAFIGQWRAVGTTSSNAAFSALELNIAEDNYTVTLSFDDFDTTSYTGEYEVSDGILTFDESFIDCTAYFYKGDSKTLVIDNGTSLVFCEHLEQESEMR